MVARGLKTPLWKRHPLTLATCHAKKALLSQQPHAAAAAEMCCFLSLTKSPFIKKKEKGLAQIYTEGLSRESPGLPVNGGTSQEAPPEKKCCPLQPCSMLRATQSVTASSFQSYPHFLATSAKWGGLEVIPILQIGKLRRGICNQRSS